MSLTTYYRKFMKLTNHTFAKKVLSTQTNSRSTSQTKQKVWAASLTLITLVSLRTSSLKVT